MNKHPRKIECPYPFLAVQKLKSGYKFYVCHLGPKILPSPTLLLFYICHFRFFAQIYYAICKERYLRWHGFSLHPDQMCGRAHIDTYFRRWTRLTINDAQIQIEKKTNMKQIFRTFCCFSFYLLISLNISGLHNIFHFLSWLFWHELSSKKTEIGI